MRAWYKIVDYDGTNYKTLFHGVNGSRTLEFNTWLESVTKQVTDGSNNRSYMSGWHITPNYGECIKYLKNFKNTAPKRIVKCQAKDIWPKPKARGDIWLAKHILIEGEVFSV